MISQIFTFGSLSPFRKHYVKVWGENSFVCRDVMMDAFGIKWSMQYGTEEEAGVTEYSLRLLCEIYAPLDKLPYLQEHEI